MGAKINQSAHCDILSIQKLIVKLTETEVNSRYKQCNGSNRN